VLLHNIQVDKINRAIGDLEREGGEPGARGEARGAAASKTSGPTRSVRIEDAGIGKAFILVTSSSRNMLSLEEMRSLVKICYGAGDAREGAARLFAWFSKNRKDVLIDAIIGKPTHPELAALYEHIKSNYRPREA
jgi:hypothetical protein